MTATGAVPASICDVLPGVAAVLGVPGAPDPLGLRAELPDCDRVVVLLIDGMGWQLLPRMAPHAPLLGGRYGITAARELACTFPSTTPTSLTSLGTGVAPGEHGILGFTVARPGAGAISQERVLTHILWRDDPPHATWAPVPTWFERAAAAGIDVRAVLPAAYAGGGLTYAAHRGARFCAVAEHEDYAARLAAEAAAGPGLVYGYTPLLDTAMHQYGIASPQWADAAAQVDALAARVLEALPPGAALLVTADHGGLDVPPERRVDVDTDERLTDGVSALAGEPRVRYVHAVDGAVGDVLATWRGVLGGSATVLTRDEAVAAGLFGPVRPGFTARIGDVVAICRGAGAIMALAREPRAYLDIVGLHGGLEPVETAIPLLTARR